MKFYIGSGFKNVNQVNELADLLKNLGWVHTYNWANVQVGSETKEDLVNYSIEERNAIEASDVVIFILPAGRGTHVEMGLSIAFGKRIVLYSVSENEFSLDNTVNFYELPEIEQVVGDMDTLVKRLVK